MSRTLIISAIPGELRAGLFEDDRAIDLVLEREDRASLLGMIFRGRILKILPSLPGAFVEIGLSRPAFLPGTIDQTEGAAITVQIVKDAFDDKAPEVTAALSLHGELSVWTPQRPGVSVSRQILPAERARLSHIVVPMLRDGEGIVLRSHAVGAAPARLGVEIARLRALYGALKAQARTGTVPMRLDTGATGLNRVIDLLAPEAQFIIVDQRETFGAARQHLKDGQDRVELDMAPGFGNRTGLDEAFDGALAAEVSLPDGARLWFDRTHACTTIDVDLGEAAGGRGKAADTIRRVNLAAASEIARQIRLRMIGGAIVIDFVGMTDRRHRQDVEASLAAAVAGDPAGVDLHGWTRIGHFELTRRRTRPALADLMLVSDSLRPRKTAATIGFEVLRALAGQKFQPSGLTAHLHPAVAAALSTALRPHLTAIEDRLGQKVRLAEATERDVESFDIAAN
jgi:Rne/Rng family ribonuclease